MRHQCPIAQSIPQRPGAINVAPSTRQLYDRDPRYDIFKKPDPPAFYSKALLSRPPIGTTDNTSVPYRGEFEQRQLYELDPRTKIQIYRKEFIAPLPVVRQKERKMEPLTNIQLGLLSTETDPTRKYFLLEMFKNKIQLTTSIKGKLAGITPADAEYLDLALNRLTQKYIAISNNGQLNDITIKLILEEYYTEIRPIYEKWKNMNPGTFDPVQELAVGLSQSTEKPQQIINPSVGVRPADITQAIQQAFANMPQPQPVVQAPPSTLQKVGSAGLSVAGAVLGAVGTVGASAIGSAVGSAVGAGSANIGSLIASGALAFGDAIIDRAQRALGGGYQSIPVAGQDDQAPVLPVPSAPPMDQVIAPPLDQAPAPSAPPLDPITLDDIFKQLTKNEFGIVFVLSGYAIPAKKNKNQMVQMILNTPNLLKSFEEIKLHSEQETGTINERITKAFIIFTAQPPPDDDLQPVSGLDAKELKQDQKWGTPSEIQPSESKEQEDEEDEYDKMEEEEEKEDEKYGGDPAEREEDRETRFKILDEFYNISINIQYNEFVNLFKKITVDDIRYFINHIDPTKRIERSIYIDAKGAPLQSLITSKISKEKILRRLWDYKDKPGFFKLATIFALLVRRGETIKNLDYVQSRQYAYNMMGGTSKIHIKKLGYGKNGKLAKTKQYKNYTAKERNQRKKQLDRLIRLL